MLAPVAMATKAQAQSLLLVQPNLGSIASAVSGSTTFAWDATGVVSKLSGNAARMSTGNTRIQVQVTCPSGGCKGGTLIATATPSGTVSGRAGAITATTFAAGTSLTLHATSGTIATFTFAGTPSLGIFYVGANYPILGDDSAKSTGVAASPFTITVNEPKTPIFTVNTVGSAFATVYRSMAISKATDLSYGRIVRPSSGSAIISLNPSTGAVSATPAVALGSPSPSRASYTVTAEGGSSFNIGVSPATMTLTGTPSGSVQVTLTETAIGAQTPGGTLGTAVTFPFGIGGSMTITSATQSGSYNGSFVVTVSYN
jgi:hypothetical protein